MKLILLSAILIAAFNTSTIMAQNKIKQTAGREQLGEFAPKFAELNDDVLFGEVWSRTDKLSLHDRSMITITGQQGHRRFVAYLPFADSQGKRSD